MVAGIPVKGKIIFIGAVAKRKSLTLFEIPITLKNKKIDYKIRFTNVIIPFGAAASNEKLKNNKQYKEIDDGTYIELIKTIKEANTLTFNFIVTNFDDDKKQLLNAKSCKFFDDSGNEYSVSQFSFGNNSLNVGYASLEKQCIKGVPIKLSVSFKDDKITNMNEVKLFELGMNHNKFQFRDITPE